MTMRKLNMRGDGAAAPAPADLRRRIHFSDEELLAECEVHTYRASGPGGQKRNKTSSAVRLHHAPSGLIVPAVESRSQHENKARALRRLREAVAVEIRLPPPKKIEWPGAVSIAAGRLEISAKNPAFCDVLALILDVFADCDGRLSEAAARLGVSSSSITRVLAAHDGAWAAANRIRAAADLGPLKQ